MKYTNFNTAANCNQYLVYSTNVNNRNISSLYLLQLIACFKSTIQFQSQHLGITRAEVVHSFLLQFKQQYLRFITCK